MNRPYALPASSPFKAWDRRRHEGWLPRGHIDGLTLSNDTTDATNDIAIAPGSARSTVRIVDGAASTMTRDQIDLDLPVAIIKELDTAFQPENYDPDGYSGGDRSPGRSSSALSNTTWHCILAGGAGLQPDVFFHDSITQSSVLAEMQKIGGYTAYRRIGSVLRSGATIMAFTQNNDEFLLTSPPFDITTSTLGATAALFALSVPLGIKVRAMISAYMTNASANVSIWITSPDQTDQTADSTAGRTSLTIEVNSQATSGDFTKRTNTSRQIRIIANGSNTSVKGVTNGWLDARDRDL